MLQHRRGRKNTMHLHYKDQGRKPTGFINQQTQDQYLHTFTDTKCSCITALWVAFAVSYNPRWHNSANTTEAPVGVNPAPHTRLKRLQFKASLFDRTTKTEYAKL